MLADLRHEIKAQRLKKILEDIDPALFDNRVEVVETLERANPALEESTLEALNNAIEMLGQDETPGPLAMQHIEAIILPRLRPAIDVIDNRYRSQPEPWEMLGESPIRDRLSAAIRSVGRIDLSGALGMGYAGTGFLVAPDLLMTNRHVAELFLLGVGLENLVFRPFRGSSINFRREIIPPLEEIESYVINEAVLVHPYWDMALLRVEGDLAGQETVSISVTHPDDLVDRNIVVIGYPAQDPRNDIDLQNFIFRGSFEVKRLLPGKIKPRRLIESFGNNVHALTHDASTLAGNSGSAIFDIDTGEVLGLHFGGFYLDTNFAVPGYELARDSRLVDAGVSFTGEVEKTDEWDTLWKDADQPNERPMVNPILGGIPIISQPRPKPEDVKPVLSTEPEQNCSVSFTIPLTISLSLGEGQSVVQQTTLNDPGFNARALAFEQTDAFEVASVGAKEGLFGSQDNDSSVIAQVNAEFDVVHLGNKGFSWDAALAALAASHLAYSNKGEVRRRCLQQWNFATCEFIRERDTECFVASTDELVLVAFRGTAGIEDWIRDLTLFGFNTPYGKIHRGFFEGFAQARASLEAELAQVEAQNKKLVITGHSLGGALASIAAAVWKDIYQINAVYSFGQPAVGKRDFGEYMEGLNAQFFRVVNDDDIVAMIPPNYRHIGLLKHLGRSGEVLTESVGPSIISEEEFRALQEYYLEADNRLEGEVQLEGLFPSIRDHNTVEYMRKILQLR